MGAKINTKSKVYQDVLSLAKTNASKRHGGLFVISPEEKIRGSYKLLYTSVLPSVRIGVPEVNAVLGKLSTLDGAIIISEKGNLVAYGALLKHTKTMKGFGTKHAAAAGITSKIPNATAVLIPERMDWIKIFQNGKVLLEMDSAERPKSVEKKILAFITDKDAALVTAAGASAAVVGLTPVLIISGTYLAIKTATGLIRKNITKMK